MQKTSPETDNLKKILLEQFSCKNILCSNFNIKNLLDNENVKKVLDDEELIKTAEIFFKNNLNITLAAKEGYMHRNTLTYRLDKIKRNIGLDIRIFDQAAVLQNFIATFKEIKTKQF